MVAMNVWPTDAADGSVASEARWRKMGRLWTPTGVAAGVGLQMAPTLAYPNLTVRNGAAWVDGHYCELLGDQVLAVTANGLCVVRFDPAANTAQLLYLDGVSVPSQSPTGTYELPIAKITGSALTDQRAMTGGAKQWNLPWGVLGYASLASTSAGYDSVVRDIAALTTTVATTPGRLMRVSLCAPFTTTVNSFGQFHIALGDNTILQSGAVSTSGVTAWANVFVLYAAAAASVTIKARVNTGAGVNLNVTASAQNPALLVVEDIGPSTSAPP